MIRLSPLQYAMLRTFAYEKADFFMTIAEAQAFDQRPFRSMLIQKWVAYRAGKGFHITREGRAACVDFEDHNIARKNPTLPLTAYFDAAAYGLGPRKPKPKVHVLARSA